VRVVESRNKYIPQAECCHIFALKGVIISIVSSPVSKSQTPLEQTSAGAGIFLKWINFISHAEYRSNLFYPHYSPHYPFLSRKGRMLAPDDS
jgi:hypothetical protein